MNSFQDNLQLFRVLVIWLCLTGTSERLAALEQAQRPAFFERWVSEWPAPEDGFDLDSWRVKLKTCGFTHWLPMPPEPK